MPSDSTQPPDPTQDPTYFPDPDAPARVSRTSRDWILPAPQPTSGQPEPRRHQVVTTRLQAWEMMDRAQHKVDRLRAHYEAAVARNDSSLADSIADDLFRADEDFRKAERKLAMFTRTPRKPITFAANPAVNTGCWALLILFVITNLPFLLGVALFIVVISAIALLVLFVGI